MSGGGVRGIAHIGVLQALNDLNYLNKFEVYVGTSVGSLVLGMYIIGYSPAMLWHLTKVFNLGDIKCISLRNLLEKFGLDSGIRIEHIIKELIKDRGYDPEISLKKLYNLTKKKLIITTVNLNTSCVCYLSHETHPNLPLCKAIRMSISVPLYYTPVEYNGDLYVDGGCMDDYPIHLFDDKLDSVLGVYLNNGKNRAEKIDNLEKYLFRILQCLIKGMSHNLTNGYDKCTIHVNIDQIMAVNFDVTQSQKKKMYMVGYNSVIKHFKASAC